MKIDGLLPPRECGNRDVCEKCKAIDDRIARYRLLGTRINDQQTQDGLARLILELETQKLALHPQLKE